MSDPCAELAGILTSRGLTCACAESVTGGLIGARITSLPGSSGYFMGSAVTYSNGSKEDVLGVPFGLIWEYGAVSEAVAKQMAKGARSLFHADIAVSCTGIAGPGGATAVKPAGLVFIGVADGNGEQAFRYVFEGSREDVRNSTADEALSLLIALAESQ